MTIVQGADPLQSLLLVSTQYLTKCLLKSGLLVVLQWRKQAGIYPEACTHEAYIQPVDAATELITALAPCTYSKRSEYASSRELVADCFQIWIYVRLLLLGNPGFLGY